MDPIELFQEYFAKARAVDREVLPDPTAMTLATAGEDGQPSARVVLLKHVDRQGFVFYTNVESRKGRELLQSGKAALCFYWGQLGIQIRVEGRAAPVSDAEADAYFETRPRESQLGAWVSSQSRPLAWEASLEQLMKEVGDRYSGQPIPRPPYWSGFRVAPARIEFWKDRPYRLHDRQLFTREGDSWRVERLYP